jgi:hypothetical protein
MGVKEKQVAAIEDSRLPERDPLPFETLHNLEIPNLAVTVRFNINLFNGLCLISANSFKNNRLHFLFTTKAFSGPYITIDSTPAEITGGRLKKLTSKY